MSFKTNNDGSNRIFLGTALTLPSAIEGIAVDALRIIFQNLYETGERLENKLISISITSSDLDDSEPDIYVAYNSILGDAWTIIDGIRRLELVLKYITGVPKKISEDLQEIFDKIKSVRDSFQHIDERIDLHFSNIGGSVFGELFWRFRENIDERENLCCIVSGISRKARNTDVETGPELEQFSQNVGVYDLSLIYIKRDSRRSPNHSKVIVSIDEAIKHVNALISHLEDQYSRFYESLDKTEKLKGSLPYKINLRVTSEAFARNKENKKRTPLM